MTALPHNEPWVALALCAQTDPEAFFPAKGGSTAAAKAVCRRCPVQRECLDFALAYESGEHDTKTSYPSGIFGGLSERERRVLRKERAALAQTGTDATAPIPTATTTDTETPAPRTYGLPYVGAANSGSHYPLPNPDRPVHIEQRATRAPSIDWDAIRADHEARRKAEGTHHEAPAPAAVQLRCRWCRKPADDLVDDVCGVCRHDAEQQFTVPTPIPDLDELEIDPDDVNGLTDDPDHNPEPPPEITGSGPLDVVDYCHQLLRDTADDPRPLVQVLRDNALSALAALDLVANPDNDEPPPAPVPVGEVESAAGTGTNFEVFKRPTRQRRARHTTGSFALAEAQRLYLDEQKTCAEIATILGSTVATVRKQLKAARTPMRDDRARNSGGANRKSPDTDDPTLVATIRRLYLDEQHTVAQVCTDVGMSPKGVTNLMKRHNIPRRPPASAPGRRGRDIKLDDTKRSDICRRYTAGESTVALARAYEVSTPTITNVLERAGIPRRTKSEARRLTPTTTTEENHQ